MTSPFSTSRWRRSTAATVLAVAATAFAVAALGTGKSFTSLVSGYEQELYGSVSLGIDGSVPISLGGVAFAPDGDLWAAECRLSTTRLHRFDAETLAAPSHGTGTRHASSVVDVGPGFCGLTNHPDGFLYANSKDGIYRLDASTGQVAPWPDGLSTAHGLPGNGLGITVDPLTGAVVYTGADCDPALSPRPAQCTIRHLDPATGATGAFAAVTSEVLHTDTVAFEPAGQYLFVSSRHTLGSSRISVLRRPEAGSPQLVQNVTTFAKAAGFGFHAATGALVTSNEQGGNMSWYAFANGYAAATTATAFAAGGFRGSYLSVGQDGCVHVTQGRAKLATDFGTRYDDGTRTTEDSIVRICGGFVPSPGVVETLNPPCTATIGDRVWLDVDADGVQDAGEPGMADVTVRLRDGDGDEVASATTGASGFYELEAPCDAAFTVEVDTPAGYAPTAIGVGLPDTDSSPSPTGVATPSDGSAQTSIDFGFVLARVAGTVFVDDNGNGVRDAGEAGLEGVEITLGGAASSVTQTATGGDYAFGGLAAGGYTVSAPDTVEGMARDTGSPVEVTLAAGQALTDLHVAYRPVQAEPQPHPGRGRGRGRGAAPPDAPGVARGRGAAGSW